jgi:hypothetical protein
MDVVVFKDVMSRPLGGTRYVNSNHQPRRSRAGFLEDEEVLPQQKSKCLHNGVTGRVEFLREPVQAKHDIARVRFGIDNRKASRVTERWPELGKIFDSVPDVVIRIHL